MRYFICLFFIAAAQFLQAQPRDSILLESITVFGLPEEKYLKGSLLSETDSTLKSHYASSHLGERLSLEFPIYFRNYGNGMISGISMRGTSPQHTAVLWNGVNINSFSLGQMDFSLLPSAAFDNVKVHQGGASARFGSGAFGGSVLLNSTIAEKNYLQLSQEVGSFGRYFAELKGATAIKRFSFQTKAYHQQSKNDFLIRQNGLRQEHASFMQRGFVQDADYRFNASSKLSFHYWYHESDREIQQPVNEHQSGDEQVDRNHRALLSYESNAAHGMLKVTTGYFNDVIIFNGARSTVSRWTGKVSEFISVLPNLKSEFTGDANLIKGKVIEYENGMAKDNRFDLAAAVYYQPLASLDLSFNIRQPFVTGFTSPMLPYLGFEYHVVKNKLALLANVSRNFRAPTLNDRYWQNAGNRNLLPEESKSLELGFKSKSKYVEVSAMYFRQRVDQWITWEPKEGSNTYVPNNLTQVDVEGIQLHLRAQFTLQALRISSEMNGQVASSIHSQVSALKKHVLGKQLIYTPRETGSGHLKLSWKNFELVGSTQFIGRRFTTQANDALYVLPQEMLFNVSMSRNFIVKQGRFDAVFQINNLTNEDYQLYPGRAMPGRNYALKIILQLNAKTNHDPKN